MPANNRFTHQQYRLESPVAPYRLLLPDPPPPAASDEYGQRMGRIGAAYREAGVVAVYLIHGTFAGNDALGLFRELGRFIPKVGDFLRQLGKRAFDSIVGDMGNYTEAYAAEFQRALAEGSPTKIPVRRFCWSSENLHVGRAEAAVRLIDELTAAELPRGGRALIWGHSHAGNVLALVTNLLAAPPSVRAEFFEASRGYYQQSRGGHVDLPIWERVETLLSQDGNPLQDVSLDVVTLGTPIRYGWDTGGYSRLLHFVNHRPRPGLPEYRAEFPVKAEDLLTVAGGDYIQQLGIAGTNSLPPLFSPRAFQAEHRLGRLLQGPPRQQNLLERLRAGVRVPDEGTTLLVDYGPAPGNAAQHLAGHAVYTRPGWLAFHAEAVAREFYNT